MVVLPSVVDKTIQKEKLSHVVTTTESYPPLPTHVATSAGNALEAGNASGKSSYANVTGKLSGKKLNICTLFTPGGRGWHTLLLLTMLGTLGNNPLILKKWHLDENLLKEDVNTILVWVKLHGVHVMAFINDGLSVISTKLELKGRATILVIFVLSMGENPLGKLRFVDDDGNPLVPTGIVESDSEVEVVFDETSNLRISRSGKDGSDKGYGTNSLLEQWRDSYLDNDDYDTYDDDMSRLIIFDVPRFRDISIVTTYLDGDDDSLARADRSTHQNLRRIVSGEKVFSNYLQHVTIFGLYTSSLLNVSYNKALNLLKKGLLIRGEAVEAYKRRRSLLDHKIQQLSQGSSEGSEVAEKQDGNVQTSLTLSFTKLEIQSMVNVPIYQEDPTVQRTIPIDTVILMIFRLYTSSLLNVSYKKALNLLKKGLLIRGGGAVEAYKRRRSLLDHKIQQLSQGSSEGSCIIPEVPNEPKDNSGSSSILLS
nr:hypothetical protein [Tanacetum cinerariifolium]